ncbi:MAG: hypothetical protein A3J66_00400 [Candidatus Magasanikbacteria bacterium RIFCSPHIGHO2_02_FULL_47_14]|uniref:Large ribosomal subunit protein bL25 n=1 Tax=Candidatus Magasanikbacteria bacterium RIFCSPHIGHO2_02_FULL_47_14 TaxID=1798680 RepID=A0A1F6MA77_9BACT|nr:MAG: hypothetical protein A3J66_00400 [Candidatus Magasanikbacteria bacterium RIFCSPHIGHO2_02_FULL_47_14]
MAFAIVAQKRTTDGRKTREQGLLPGVVYGQGIQPISIAVPYSVFDKLYNQAGEASLIDFSVQGEDGKPVKVLIQDVQRDPVKGKMIHVDLRQIDMTIEMTATVELSFVGQSLAEKELGGTLMKTLNTIAVRCLPQDLVNEVEVDLSVLKTFDDVIHISDLKLPAGVVCSDNVDTVVAKVSAPITEEQFKAMEEQGPGTVEEVKVESEEKKKEKEAEAAAAAEKAE